MKRYFNNRDPTYLQRLIIILIDSFLTLRTFFTACLLWPKKTPPARNVTIILIFNMKLVLIEKLKIHSSYNSILFIEGIMVSDIAQWQNPGYGLSICCWLRLDALENPGSSGSNYRRQLFKY